MTPQSYSTGPEAPRRISYPAVDARTWTLPNGLGIIVQEDHSAPVASVQAWIETGSIHETQHMGAGLSHLLEHMLFKGTPTRGASAFAQSIQDAGGYINAYTSFERTVYWIDIPAKGVPVALDLLSDAVMNSTLPVEEYAKEQEVIRREFAMGMDDPDRMSGQALFATAFREHPCRHPIIGYLDVFNSLQRDEVMAYYKGRYVPNNMFFVVVGDVDADAVHAKLAELFAPHPRRSLPPVFIPQEPPQLGRRVSHAEFPTELTRLHMAWHIPPSSHADIPALDVAAVVLGSGRSSHLYKSLREDLAIVHSADAWCYALMHGGLFGVDAVLDPGKREQVEREVLWQIGHLRDQGVTAQELTKAKKASLSHQLQSVTTMRGRASDLGSNWLVARNLDFSRDYLEAVQQVTSEDIRRVLAKYLVDQNLSVVSLNPPGSLASAKKIGASVTAGEIQKFELSNGLRLLVREDHRLPLVSINASFKAGLLAETAANNGLTRLLSKVLLKGTKTRTAGQIADQIEEMGGVIGSDAGNNSVNVSARVMQPDFRAGLEILADVLCHATMPEKAVSREKEAQLAAIKSEEEEMTVVARNILRAELFGAHPYGLRASGTPESVASITPDALRAFRDRHLVARNGVLAVFGDVRAEEVRAVAEELLGALPAGEPALVAVAEPPALSASREVESIKDKEQAVLMVGFPGTDLFSPDNAALEIIDEACSDLGSRLFMRIREEMGLAYFVGSSQMSGLARGMFGFYLGTDPAKVADVKAALNDEIAKLAAHGLAPEELARAKEKYIGQQEIRNQSNQAFAFQASLNELYGLGHNYHLEQRRQIEALTVEQVQAVARKYFTQPAITAVVRPNA
ncbi:MAG: pitrilysin family protein [Chthoniobacter sp.]|nr:pitrilysin family protein [Chthoniobacter sp.]